jgi:electron transport complex protein RnfD
MNFITKKPPLKASQERSYKRLLTLHIALLIVSVAAIVTRALIPVAEGASWSPENMFKTFTMLAVGALVSVLIELVYSISEGKSHEFADYKRLVDPINTGLLIALLLPVSTPIYVLVLAVGVGVYAGKIVFGGYGNYIFNPALVGVLFATISFDGVLVYGQTPLTLLKEAIQGATHSMNVLDLLAGNYTAVAIGSTSALVLLFVFVYLCINKVIDLRTSLTFVLSIVLISFGVGFINFGLEGGATTMYVFVNFLTGLTMFGAVFLVSETVTSPTSRETKMIYAVIVAVMTMAVRVLGTAVEGVVFAVLLGNMLTPFLNRTVKRSDKNMLIKTSVILVVIVLATSAILGFILQSRLVDVFNAATIMIGGIN